jgi:hypothetical protein
MNWHAFGELENHDPVVSTPPHAHHLIFCHRQALCYGMESLGRTHFAIQLLFLVLARFLSLNHHHDMSIFRSIRIY